MIRVVDGAGRPVEGASVSIRDFPSSDRPKPGLTDARGNYEVLGLKPEQVTVVDIIASAPSLGATVEVEPRSAGEASKPLEVQLEPLGSLTGRVRDEDGQPVEGAVVQLYRNIRDRHRSGRSFGLPVETRNELEPDGSYTFKQLIPGASYNTNVEAGGFARSSSAHVNIKAGQESRLDDYRLPSAAREVRGVVVDARGNPAADVTVNYESDHRRALYAPQGSTWFQQTDARGRFHLTGLPRGPVRLMVYRRPSESDRSIRDIKRIDVPQGEDGVRIELPDPNSRLRGIE
jgi:hypothetical protein